MKEYNYLQTIYMSFYSGNLYRDVVKNWEAGVVLYLLILLAISWTVIVIKMQPGLGNKIEIEMTKLEPQVPNMIIQDGHVTTPEYRPYIIKDPDSKEILAIIDTSGQHQNYEDVMKTTSLLITKTDVVYKDRSNVIKIQQIPKSLNYHFTFAQAKKILVTLGNWIWAILLPFLILFSLAYRLIQAVIYGIFGKIFALLMGVTLSFSKILKISMIAVTPAIVLSTVVDVCSFSLPMAKIIYFILSMIYLIFGIKANKEA